jgi:hypothetical protein
MVSQCFNPECRADFLYWRHGRLVAVRSAQHSKVEFFWLCGTCAGNFTIGSGLDGSVRLKALARYRAKAIFHEAVAA